MITNIDKVGRDGKSSDSTPFWTYNIICDKCNAFIKTETTVRIPNLNETHICKDCENKDKNK